MCYSIRHVGRVCLSAPVYDIRQGRVDSKVTTYDRLGYSKPTHRPAGPRPSLEI